jgi:hypothetical protein
MFSPRLDFPGLVSGNGLEATPLASPRRSNSSTAAIPRHSGNHEFPAIVDRSLLAAEEENAITIAGKAGFQAVRSVMESRVNDPLRPCMATAFRFLSSSVTRQSMRRCFSSQAMLRPTMPPPPQEICCVRLARPRVLSRLVEFHNLTAWPLPERPGRFDEAYSCGSKGPHLGGRTMPLAWPASSPPPSRCRKTSQGRAAASVRHHIAHRIRIRGIFLGDKPSCSEGSQSPQCIRLWRRPPFRCLWDLGILLTTRSRPRQDPQ